MGWAATAGGEQVEDLDEGEEQPPAPVPKAVLSQRAAIMFSGQTGGVVASGDGAATSSASYKLISDVIEVVDALPGQLFDRHAPHRPCGLLDKLSAQGMLIGDLLGLPLLSWALAEPIGKAAAKLKKKLPEKKKEARKKAKRRGLDVEASRRRQQPWRAVVWRCRCLSPCNRLE